MVCCEHFPPAQKNIQTSCTAMFSVRCYLLISRLWQCQCECVWKSEACYICSFTNNSDEKTILLSICIQCLHWEELNRHHCSCCYEVIPSPAVSSLGVQVLTKKINWSFRSRTWMTTSFARYHQEGSKETLTNYPQQKQVPPVTNSTIWPVLPLCCYGIVLDFMIKNTRFTKKTLDYKSKLTHSENVARKCVAMPT